MVRKSDQLSWIGERARSSPPPSTGSPDSSEVRGLHNLHDFSSSPICVCMLSHFSLVQLFVTLWIIAHQASLFMGFFRQEYWSGLSCPAPGDLPNLGTEPTSLVALALAGGFFSTSATCKDPLHIFLPQRPPSNSLRNRTSSLPPIMFMNNIVFPELHFHYMSK